MHRRSKTIRKILYFRNKNQANFTELLFFYSVSLHYRVIFQPNLFSKAREVANEILNTLYVKLTLFHEEGQIYTCTISLQLVSFGM